LRAGTAHRRRVEAALLPDQPGEEIDRQIIFRRRRGKGVTDAVNSGRNARSRWGLRLDGFDWTDLVGFTCVQLRKAGIRQRARDFRGLRLRPPRHGLAGDDGHHTTGWPRGERSGKQQDEEERGRGKAAHVRSSLDRKPARSRVNVHLAVFAMVTATDCQINKPRESR
jgi:hypothetical protein